MISGPDHAFAAAALRCWSAARSPRLVPRYVFAAINLIILAVWILSGGDLRHRRRFQPRGAPATTSPVMIPSKKKPEIWTDVSPSPDSPDLDSTTTVAGEEAPSGSAEKKAEEEGGDIAAAAAEQGLPPEPQSSSEDEEAAAGVSGRGFGKSETFPSRREGWRRRKRDFALADEQDRRFEAFIRATYEQMRMQREESLIQHHRRQIQLEVAN